ncbi:hypothetical protein [Mesorhizobium sp. CAU 1732]|uniref:hypothetical protein n=1 Tax=Mesorhizobium sp. CAU 1732 TaxID=3140358 RepID=UPI00326119E9
MSQTIQLRRYSIAEGKEDAFLASWSSQIPQLRRKYGFEIKFAYLDRGNGLFVWAVAVEGDEEAFLAAERSYYGSPEKAGLGNGDPSILRDISVGFVQPVH